MRQRKEEQEARIVVSDLKAQEHKALQSSVKEHRSVEQLNARQVQVRDYILAYQREYGERPMYKEIMAACGIRSSRTVHKCIKRLESASELRLQYVSRDALPSREV